jgi:hypothetical protein
VVGHFGTPDRNRPLHHFHSRAEAEFFNQIARPFFALMTGVKAFAFYTVSDLA